MTDLTRDEVIAEQEAMLTTDTVPIERRGKLCTVCGKIVPELEAEGHCAGHAE